MFWREAALDPCPAHPPLTWAMIPKNLPLHHLFSSPHAEVNFMRKSKRLSLMLSMAPILFFLMLLVHVRADPFSSSSSSSSCLDQFSSWNLQALSYAQPRSSFSSWWCYLWSLSCFLSPFKDGHDHVCDHQCESFLGGFSSKLHRLSSYLHQVEQKAKY